MTNKRTDTMTPIQRNRALQQGETPDRLPIILFHGTIGAKVAGMGYQESNATAENIAKKEILSYQRYGFDDVAVSYGLTSLGRALGSEYKLANDSAPAITKYVLADIDQLDALDFSRATFSQDPNLQKHFQAIQLIHQAIGDEVACTYDMVGPWTAAASIVEPEKLLRYTRKKKDQVHALMRRTTDAILGILDHFAQLPYLEFSLTDPFASGELLGPKQYQEFCLPYTKEVVDRIHAFDKKVYIHICGDTTKILPLIVQTGVDAISLDQKVDLQVAKELVGDEVALIGNVDPVKYFYHGDAQSMDEAVRECFAKAYDTPRGFAIGAGCSVPFDTPLENIQAFMDAARKYGQYPILSEKIIKI